jgi:hypothetical protein
MDISLPIEAVEVEFHGGTPRGPPPVLKPIRTCREKAKAWTYRVSGLTLSLGE